MKANTFLCPLSFYSFTTGFFYLMRNEERSDPKFCILHFAFCIKKIPNEGDFFSDSLIYICIASNRPGRGSRCFYFSAPLFLFLSIERSLRIPSIYVRKRRFRLFYQAPFFLLRGKRLMQQKAKQRYFPSFPAKSLTYNRLLS